MFYAIDSSPLIIILVMTASYCSWQWLQCETITLNILGRFSLIFRRKKKIVTSVCCLAKQAPIWKCLCAKWNDFAPGEFAPTKRQSRQQTAFWDSFFLTFRDYKAWYFMWIHMKYQVLFSLKTKINDFRMSATIVNEMGRRFTWNIKP